MKKRSSNTTIVGIYRRLIKDGYEAKISPSIDSIGRARWYKDTTVTASISVNGWTISANENGSIIIARADGVQKVFDFETRIAILCFQIEKFLISPPVVTSAEVPISA